MGTPPSPAELLSHCPLSLKCKISLTEPWFLDIGGVGWAHSVAGGSPLSRPSRRVETGGGAGELVFPRGSLSSRPLAKNSARGPAFAKSALHPAALDSRRLHAGFLSVISDIPGSHPACRIRSLGPINLEADAPGGCAGQKARPSGRRQQRAALRRSERSSRVSVSSRRLQRATPALA